MKFFCYLIKRQLGVDIRGFRTDNAKDFCNHELREFFENEGIKHKTSCSYTPQQNGLVERKIGDIMNTGRTLMADAFVPKYL